MTHRQDVAGGHDVAARWCLLAEQRLKYLTELFENGRWRRYYSELAFLENIEEAKNAVEIWRGLSVGDQADLQAGTSPMKAGAVLPADAASTPQLDLVALKRALIGSSAPARTLTGTTGAKRDIRSVELRYPALRNLL